MTDVRGASCAGRAVPEPVGLAIKGYASLWGVEDLNGDVVARGSFAASLAKTGVGRVRMLHQHEARSVVGVWDRIEEDERGLCRRAGYGLVRRGAFRPGAEPGQSTGRAVDRVPQPSGAARRDGRLRVLVEVKLWEVSLVTFPMLPGARFGVVSGSGDRIETVKSS